MPEPGLSVTQPNDILDFWFEELEESQWFVADEGVDAEIRRRFGELHARVSTAVPDEWLATRGGLLAAIVVLDQFSRNLYRDDPRAYAHDTAALNLTHLAIERGWDTEYSPQQRMFLYMPFQHAEDMRAQDRAVELFAEVGLEEPLDYAHRHRDVIRRFGRFPGRNEALGRDTTPEEQRYLDEGGGF